jgi:ABC-type multidrug transport system fused ATPase/permease subunit
MGSKASTVMSEVVSSVRTVASFTLEESMLAQFREAMDLYQKEAKFKAAFSGSARAFSQSSIFIGFGFICEFPPYKLF